eukprot:TRINITY_DN9835_c0_g1_i1.p1 TRINITY_DN9835_c0_g1~~TRINITY_DN9835_c0_g1_i1.p1  ORF type:complete len:148 (-),score=26.15 TRINITY_DN9835_c0_g1_i1:5-448(-)
MDMIMLNQSRKFFADCCCCKLAKHLRTLGYDTKWVACISDKELVKQCKEEGRILLTMDSTLPKEQNYQIKGLSYYVFRKCNRPVDQLQEVIKTFDLKIEEEKFFTRCLLCNDEIVKISKEKIRDRVVPGVYEKHEEFFVCKSCDKIY